MDSARPPLLHPLLAARWSPVRFDETAQLTPDEVDSVLEAARWSPSAGNSQPWAFIVGRRGDANHQRLIAHLAGSSRPWAATASLLVANLSHRFVADTEWEFSEFSLYDLGQAVAHMTLQAQSLGFAARQFRAFDREGVTSEFAVPPHWEVTTMTAFGKAAPDRGVDLRHGHGPGDRPDRVRRLPEELRWPPPAADSS